MMTGDGEKAARTACQQLGITEYYARVLPEDKAAKVEEIKAQVYSSHRIEELCRNDIRFMWLTGNVTPDPVSYTHLDVYKRQVPAFLGKMVRGDRQGHIRRGGTVLPGTLGRQPQDSGGTG